MAAQEFRHALSRAVVLAHAQRQRLQALDELEGIEGRHRGTDVPQQHDPGAQQKGDGAQRLCRLQPDRTVIGGIGFAQQREARGMVLPREIAAVDDGATDRSAVAADVFGGRVNDDGRPMFEGPGRERSGGIVEDERHPELAADLAHFTIGKPQA